MRLILLGRDEADYVLVQTLGRIVALNIGFEAVFVFVDLDGLDEIYGFLVGHYAAFASVFFLILLVTVMKCAMSAAVLFQPSDTRMALCARFGATPMASSTCERCNFA